MRISEFFQKAGRPVAYYSSFAKALNSVNAALLLCQLLYWMGKQKNKEGWIYKSREEIFEEIGLSRSEQETARRRLKELGILEEKIAGVPATVHFKINLLKIEEILESQLA